MSTANVVPETHGLDSDDARRTLARAGRWEVTKSSAARFRWADGFSHSRALAFQIVLTIVPGVIVAVGLAATTHSSALNDAIVRAINSLAPGPAGDVFRDAAGHGAATANNPSGWKPLMIGSVVMMFSAATTFGQIERGANRIYGVEKDRPSVQKYGLASLMALSAGMLFSATFVLVAIGRDIGQSFDSSAWSNTFAALRWPVGAILLIIAYGMVFKLSPRRHQPTLSWLAVGAALSVVLTLAVSAALSFYLNLSSNFGDTYGPLAGFMGLMLWAYLTSIALFLGLAFAAQLEAIRAGEAAPQSTEKVEDTEPESTQDDVPVPSVASGRT